MSARPPGEDAARPDAGDILLVIHEFVARSSDELSLVKGDRVELIERDDEFGDGWFLGRHLVSSNTGLFPEVYTRPAPKNTVTSMPPPFTLPRLEETPSDAYDGDSGVAEQPQAGSHLSLPPQTIHEPVPNHAPLPLNSAKKDMANGPPLAHSGIAAAALSQDSHVLNDTLNVIDEHITNLRSPPSHGAFRSAGNDSGSEYSLPIDHRMSYIHGDETDEEEDGSRSRAEVAAWSPDEVAEHLFTSGVEKQHCEVFRDQEITGEVLLGMDQSSLFIQAFDLGSVGRRLKTWHKIKSLQDEVSGGGRMSQVQDSDAGSDIYRRQSRSRTNTLTNSVSTRPTSIHTRPLSMSQTQTSKGSPTTLGQAGSHLHAYDGPSRPSHAKRPSAASVRDLNHSRRHSSTTEFRAGSEVTPSLQPSGTFPLSEAGHKKQPSFDRNWTLGGALSQTASRPLSSAGSQQLSRDSRLDLQDSAVELDRGYFSGTDADAKKRNVLRKRTSGHSRQGSYAEEQRIRSATALSRQSRFGSIDASREAVASSAAQKYYGLQDHRRSVSTKTSESYRPPPPAKDGPSPTVTKLDGGPAQSPNLKEGGKLAGMGADWLAAVASKQGSKNGTPAQRSISDGMGLSASKPYTAVDAPLPSPARTGSSTPSVVPSFEFDSPDAGKTPMTPMTPASKSSNRRKNKKETSAYTRGLLPVKPQDAMKDADYSGWMKKKSSNMMTTWKPRLFVLKGRRLAYYYSEDDDQERGLIDISFHRVLPADNEKLTSLHATLTGAGSTPNSSSSSALKDTGDSMFIFKLVPPRAGLSRAVNFTKPTVHYFAVSSLQAGRLWMAALMKATIDRDDVQPVVTSYQQKTISLAKAQAMRHRPPALMNLEEGQEASGARDDADATTSEAAISTGAASPPSGHSNRPHEGLGIFSGADSGVAGLEKLAVSGIDSGKLDMDFGSGKLSQ